MKPCLFLAIETSCDETSVAIFDEQLHVKANVIASQTKWHERFGGVVPEVAARAHMELLTPTIAEALSTASISMKQIGAVAVHHGPGLAGALLVGLSSAKMIALGLGVPLIGVNHVHSHLYACRMSAGREIFPCVGMVVSGGHTILFDCESALQMKRLGGTIDDAAGEAFDKVANLLGLGFPGGPALEKEARLGSPKAYSYPRSFIHEERLDFSFSGLKTAVLYSIAPPGEKLNLVKIDALSRANMAASFQEAVVDVLAVKCLQALKRTGRKRLAVGGGVIANNCLRDRLAMECSRLEIELFVPQKDLCTDNAAMAALAVEYWKEQRFSDLSLDVCSTVY